MAVKIKFMRSYEPGHEPKSLMPLEIAVNVPDRLLFYNHEGEIHHYSLDNLPLTLQQMFIEGFDMGLVSTFKKSQLRG